MRYIFSSSGLTPQQSLIEQSENTPPRGAMIVADPRDAVVWGHGLLDCNQNWEWQIISTCCDNDPERESRFASVLERLNAEGTTIELNVGPEEPQFSETEHELAIESLLSHHDWDLIVTHGPIAECANRPHSREVCHSVVRLWENHQIHTRELWMFANGFENGRSFPSVQEDASVVGVLDDSIRKRKYDLLSRIYGLSEDSWEVRAAPSTEGFNAFTTPESARKFIYNSRHSERLRHHLLP